MIESSKEYKYSKRVVFPKGEQKRFLEKTQSFLNVSSRNFAQIAGVNIRSMTDWKREKYFMSLDGLSKLCKKAKVILPKNIKLKDSFWYVYKGGKIGGLASYQKYGSIGGNPEYRNKKWREWWDSKGRFNKDSITFPLFVTIPPKSSKLCEFIGIVLGDGSITKKQISITLNRFDDKDFAIYVSNLFKSLFKVSPSLYYRESVVNIVVSRMELVKFMVNIGLNVGGKVRQQTNVPQWINSSENFIRSCVRGLFDTDGCFYVDKHAYKSKIYLNPGINFTNRSLPILNFFKNSLIKFGFHPTQKTPFSIFLRREDEIIRYFDEIRSSNVKHLNKFNKYFQNKLGEVPKWT